MLRRRLSVNRASSAWRQTANRETLELEFDKVVGFGYVSDAPAGSVGARPGRPRRVEMSAVRVVIAHDPGMSNGFRVYTAFPIVRLPQ